VRRKQRTLARISYGLRIPFTTKPLASGSLFKLERKSSKVVQDGEPKFCPAMFSRHFVNGSPLTASP